MRELSEGEKKAWRAICDSVLNSPKRKVRFLPSPLPTPSRVIDLHGMTQDEAYSNIKFFILRNFSANQYDLIIITGKGANGTGSLKRLVPYWLSSSLKQHVRSCTIDPKNVGQLIVSLKK